MHLKKKATSNRICFKLWSQVSFLWLKERAKKTRRSRSGYILISQYLCKGLRRCQMNYLQKKTLILIYSRHNLFAKFDSSVERSLYAKKVVPRHLSQTTLAHSYKELNGLKFKGKSQGLRTDSKSSRVQCSPWKRQDFTMPQRRWAARSYTSCQSKLQRSHFGSVMLSCCTYASPVWLVWLVRTVSTGMHQILPMCCTSQSGQPGWVHVAQCNCREVNLASGLLI